MLERADRHEPGKGSILEALGRAYFNSGQADRARVTLSRCSRSTHRRRTAITRSVRASSGSGVARRPGPTCDSPSRSAPARRSIRTRSTDSGRSAPPLDVPRDEASVEQRRHRVPSNARHAGARQERARQRPAGLSVEGRHRRSRTCHFFAGRRMCQRIADQFPPGVQMAEDRGSCSVGAASRLTRDTPHLLRLYRLRRPASQSSATSACRRAAPRAPRPRPHRARASARG